MFFGLGVGELLLLVGVVALLGGPAAVIKLARMYKSAQQAKSELTGKAILDKIMTPDDKPKRKKKRRKKKRHTSS